MKVSVIVRTRDDEKYLKRTLEAVKRTTIQLWLLVMNNNSDNRPLPDDCRALADAVVRIPDGDYVPGAVLNQAMELTGTEIVVFLNADCVPLNSGWLEALIAPFDDPRVGATFGCQVPRVNCFPPFARDTLDTFGDGHKQRLWRHCFSMAVSAVRREVWEAVSFDSRLRYSEDIAWSYAVKQYGMEICYTPGAVVEHSHNYSLVQYYRRQRGEGRAEAVIFTWNSWRSGLLRYSLLPFFRQVLRDCRFCLRGGFLFWIPGSFVYRLVGAIGRRRGFVTGRGQ